MHLPKRARHKPTEKVDRRRKPELTIPQILDWADTYHNAYGTWPTRTAGRIFCAKGENWMAVNACLIKGVRGLPGGLSLSQLLKEHRGVRNVGRLPPLTEAQILRWADEHHRRTGSWPQRNCGTIPESGGEEWINIDQALSKGHRDLPVGSSLAKLLAEERGVRNAKQAPRLTQKMILRWADAHYKRTGKWPRIHSGPIIDAPGETWSAVHTALALGNRGLPGGCTLPMLLAAKRDVLNYWTRPRLTIENILAWADAFHERTGQWPRVKAVPIPEAPGETWHAVDSALRKGGRGLPRAGSLPALLAKERGVPHRFERPPLTNEKILEWAEHQYRVTGSWPNCNSGAIVDVPGETWAAINAALSKGQRGMPGGSSLAKLLAKRWHIGRWARPAERSGKEFEIPVTLLGAETAARVPPPLAVRVGRRDPAAVTRHSRTRTSARRS